MLFFVISFSCLILSVMFLLIGIAMYLFGKRVSNSHRIEIQVLQNTISAPYHTGLVFIFSGLVLMAMTQSFFGQGSNDTVESPSVSMSFFVNSSFAQQVYEVDADQGWVYFGYEKNPANWNFDFEFGSFNDLVENSPEGSVVLISNKDMNIRAQPFGDFTGTVFGFLDPIPPVTGTLDTGTCIELIDSESVGFSKRWIEFRKIECQSANFFEE